MKTNCCWTKLVFICTHAVTPIYWYPSCDEGKCSLHCRVPEKDSGQLMLKKGKLLDGFQGKSLFWQNWVCMRATGCVILLWLVGEEVTGLCPRNLNHQSPGSNQPGVHTLGCLISEDSILNLVEGLSSSKRTQR